MISKPGCHLCAVARELIEAVAAEFPEDSIEIEEFSILDDPALFDLWWEKIPVVMIDDQLHAHWRLSADRLRADLAASLSHSQEHS